MRHFFYAKDKTHQDIVRKLLYGNFVAQQNKIPILFISIKLKFARGKMPTAVHVAVGLPTTTRVARVARVEATQNFQPREFLQQAPISQSL